MTSPARQLIVVLSNFAGNLGGQRRVPLGVDLGDVGRCMPQDDLCRLETKLTAYRRCCGVPQPVRTPSLHLGSVAGPMNRSPIRVGVVSVPWPTTGRLLPICPWPIAARSAVSCGPGAWLVVAAPPILPGIEAERLGGPQEKRDQDRLGLGAEWISAGLPPMLRLVARRDINPDVCRPFDVAGPHLAYLIGPAAREQLEFDHSRDDRAEVLKGPRSPIHPRPGPPASIPWRPTGLCAGPVGSPGLGRS